MKRTKEDIENRIRKIESRGKCDSFSGVMKKLKRQLRQFEK